MQYIDQERAKATGLLQSLFRDPGNGEFKNLPRNFVLSDPALNLWGGIREDVVEYFNSNGIQWWDSGDEPTGHLLSSQIACINHLFFIRQREELATEVLRAIDPKIQRAIQVDNGYVEFEKTGKIKLGLEKNLSRGANCTSIDAMMVGKYDSGKRVLFLIEWKYVESYSSASKATGKSGQTRLQAYDKLLTDPNCPIKCANIKDLYYEPFCQLMRQILLGWEMVNRREYGADDFMHVHVIPEANITLKNNITSPGLRIGYNNIADVWKSVLKDPLKYQAIDPKALLSVLDKYPDTLSLLKYLEKRYW